MVYTTYMLHKTKYKWVRKLIYLPAAAQNDGYVYFVISCHTQCRSKDWCFGIVLPLTTKHKRMCCICTLTIIQKVKDGCFWVVKKHLQCNLKSNIKGCIGVQKYHCKIIIEVGHVWIVFSLTLILLELYMINLCHPCSLIRLYTVGSQLQVLILISWKMIMDRAKNWRWIIPFKKFSRLRAKLRTK